MPDATAAAAPPEEPPALRVQIEGIARRTEKNGLAGHVEAEFGKIGLAKNAEARLFETDRQFVVVVLRRRTAEGAAGAAGALACNAGADVLQQERHAGERASARGIFYRFVIKIDNGVDLGVLFRDPSKRCLQAPPPLSLPQRGSARQAPSRHACAYILRAHASAACSEAAASDSLRIASSTVRCRRWNSGDATMS